MRDIQQTPAAPLAGAIRIVKARLRPHAIAALVASVFLSLVASLALVYLAAVMPSFDRIFGPAAPAPVALKQAPLVRIIRPQGGQEAAVAAAPERWQPAAQQPRLAPAAGPEPTFSRPAVRAEHAPRILAGRPPVVAPPRPAGLGPAPVEQDAPALIASARPAPRPAGFAATAAPEPPATAAVQLASMARPAIDTAPRAAAGSCSTRLTRAIPRRPRTAAGGAQFVAGLGDASGRARDQAVVRELLSGNVPDFLRRLVPVHFARGDTSITICVTPDYLAVGSDRDYVRVPLGLAAAGQVAEAFGMMLPTTRMVDAIYAQAAVRLAPSPMPAGAQMASTSYFLRHNRTVQAQLVAAGAPLGVLVAGQKKDLVLTNRLAANPGRVAIYGWHRPNGRAIQPLSTVHGAAYADYSHGIRLVSRTAYLNGRPVDLRDLLQDARHAGLLNDGGVIGAPAIRIASR